MVDYKRFSTFVKNTGVRKGWDYVVKPDGTRVAVEPGKYFRVSTEKPLVFGIEDLTEEIGQTPDWDFNEPICEVLEESGLFRKTIRLKCTYSSGYENHLYFDNKLVEEFESGSYVREVEISYMDWFLISLTTLGGIGVVGLAWMGTKGT